MDWENEKPTESLRSTGQALRRGYRAQTGEKQKERREVRGVLSELLLWPEFFIFSWGHILEYFAEALCHLCLYLDPLLHFSCWCSSLEKLSCSKNLCNYSSHQ